MKKLILLSGLPASGKTHTSKGFELMFEEKEVFRIEYYSFCRRPIRVIIPRRAKLLIIEGVPASEIRDSYDRICRSFTAKKVIFEVSEMLSPSKFEDIAHTINCMHKNR